MGPTRRTHIQPIGKACVAAPRGSGFDKRREKRLDFEKEESLDLGILCRKIESVIDGESLLTRPTLLRNHSRPLEIGLNHSRYLH